MRSHSPLVCGILALVLTFVPSFCLSQAASSSVAVSITSDTSTVTSAQSLQLTALIKNTSNVAVKWSASAGTITSSGLYHAPRVTTDTVVTVKATSVANPASFDTISLVVTAAKPTQTVASTASTTLGKTIQESFFGAGFNSSEPGLPPTARSRLRLSGGFACGTTTRSGHRP